MLKQIKTGVFKVGSFDYVAKLEKYPISAVFFRIRAHNFHRFSSQFSRESCLV